MTSEYGVKNGACRNYNYMTFVTQTWTSTTDSQNTYKAIYISGGIPRTNNASETNYYKWVHAVYADELFIKGDGSKNNPYIVNKSGK